MTNIYEINDLVDFIDEHDITVKQFLYCLLLYYDKKHSRIEGSHKISKPLSKIYKYHSKVENFTINDKKILEDKGFITIEEGGDKKLAPDLVEITDKFAKKWYGDKYKIEQLLETYPTHIENFKHPGGSKIPLQAFDNYERLSKRYNQLVKTYKMHNRVLSLVQWAKEKGHINMGIEKFINSKGWEHLQEIKDKNSQDNIHEI